MAYFLVTTDVAYCLLAIALFLTQLVVSGSGPPLLIIYDRRTRELLESEQAAFTDLVIVIDTINAIELQCCGCG